MKRIIKKRIYYFHGFRSAGEGSKFETLKRVYGEEYEILSPTLPNNVYEARAELRLIAKEFNEKDEVRVIGTSLGAFYAYYFASVLFSSGAILINPVLDPEVHMRKYLGKNRNFETGKKFEFTEHDLAEFEYMKKEMEAADACFTATQIALGKNDDIVDVEKVAEWFFDEHNVKFYDDDHRFNNKFEEMLREERTRKFIEKPWFFLDTGLLEELEDMRDNPDEK